MVVRDQTGRRRNTSEKTRVEANEKKMRGGVKRVDVKPDWRKKRNGSLLLLIHIELND